MYLDFNRFAFGNGSTSALKIYCLNVFDIQWYEFVVTYYNSNLIPLGFLVQCLFSQCYGFVLS